ncbi:glycosyltransferase family 2 protein [Nocardioides zeae]
MAEERWELFWSLSFALHRDAWAASGGFDEAYAGYGGEDTDFGQRCARAGLDLRWDGAARAYHQHHPVSRPPVEHAADIVRNGRLFAARWGWWPMTGWLEEMAELGVVRRSDDGWELEDGDARG